MRALVLLVLMSCVHVQKTPALTDSEGRIEQRCTADTECALRLVGERGEDELFAYNVAERSRAEKVGRSPGLVYRTWRDVFAEQDPDEMRGTNEKRKVHCGEAAPACVAARCVVALREVHKSNCGFHGNGRTDE